MEPIVDTTPKVLPKRSARTLPMPAGCAVAVGLTFSALPCVMAVVLIGVRLSHLPDPPSGFYFFGLLSALAFGMGFLISGIRTLRRARAGARRRAEHPGEPWYADWAWDPTRARAESGLGFMALLTVGLFGLCASFTWAYVEQVLPAPTAGEPGVLAAKIGGAVIIAFWDIVLIALVKSMISDVLRERRTGPSTLHFAHFPFFVGEPLRARVTSPHLLDRDSVVVTLRCLEERMTSEASLKGDEDRVEVVQLYEARETRTVRRADIPEVDVSFPLPRGDYETHLAPPPPAPRYWEIELEVGTPGKDEQIRFLVPVYVAPALQ